MARVTVVNDNPEFLELMHDILEDDRYETTTIDGDRDDALDAIRASRPDLLIIDLRRGPEELHGWDVAQQVRRQPELGGLPILVCSADTAALEAIKDELAATRHVATLTKPFRIDALNAAIDGLLAEVSPRQEPIGLELVPGLRQLGPEIGIGLDCVFELIEQLHGTGSHQPPHWIRLGTPRLAADHDEDGPNLEANPALVHQ